ncbi:MAG: thiamine phosphate synthase, partial [Candidatus Sumerlaeia bacterium]|nr:thiamine phosphate synthase [Candidatus Sumerlaeia bacterium]
MNPRLVGITDRRLADGAADLVRRCEALCEGGADAILLREKDLPAGELLALARALREATAAHGALLLVADRLDAALAAGADGCHLGRASLPLEAARALVPPGFILGASCHSAEELEEAARSGADYAFLSPVFAPNSKAGGEPLGLERFAALAAECPLPVLALGGLDAERARACRAAGADGVAAIGALFGAAD